MGQSSTGGSRSSSPSEKGDVTELGPEDKIVLHKVEVIRHREVINVPELVMIPTETIKYETTIQPTTKYEVDVKSTTRYDEQVEETIRYTILEEETIKYVPRETVCEKPVIVEKVYERPVLVEKEYILVTYNDIAAIRELMDLAPKLLDQLREIRDYRIVEEVIKVPKLQYVTTTIKKIAQTGELIDDAD